MLVGNGHEGSVSVTAKKSRTPFDQKIKTIEIGSSCQKLQIDTHRHVKLITPRGFSVSVKNKFICTYSNVMCICT